MHSFLALDWGQRSLLLRVAVLLVVIRLAQGRLRFETLRGLVVGRTGTVASPNADGSLVDRVMWAVRAVSRRTAGWTTCLTQALTGQAMLARHGHPSRLYVGVARGDQGQLEGHAWLEQGGRILIGGSAEEVQRFTTLTVFRVSASRTAVARDAAAGRTR